MVQLLKHALRTVANGREALDELQRNPPDVILTDIAMPVMGGLELVKCVKAKTEFAHVPIVVMTAYERGYLTWAWAAGANGTIAKPFEPEDLFTAILEVLPNRIEH